MLDYPHSHNSPREHFMARDAGRLVAALFFLLTSLATLASNHMEAPPLRLHPAAIVGASTNERAEILLVNECDRATEIILVTTDVLGEVIGNSSSSVTVNLEPQSSIVVPLPLPDAGGNRRYINLEMSSHQGHCTAPGRRSLRAAVAIEDKDGKIVRNAGLRSDGDLVQAPSRKAGHKLFVGGLSWNDNGELVPVGEGQAVDLVLKSHCPTEVIVSYEVRVEGQGPLEEPMAFETILAPGGGAVISLPVEDTQGKWLDINVQYTPLADSRRTQRKCLYGGISASIELFNLNDGGTAAGIDLPVKLLVFEDEDE